MRSKRLLAVLLALCLFVSVMGPMANAVTIGADTHGSETAGKSQNATKQTSSPFRNDRVVDAEQSDGLKNLRDDPMVRGETKTDPEDSDGSWIATERKDGASVSLINKEASDSLAELKEAAQVYDDDDLVTAFVVMEEDPLAESYSSIAMVSEADERDLLNVQQNVISSIEKDVLKGDELEVRYQFTYLTNAFSIVTEFGNLSDIAEMKGVKSVYLVPVYEPCTVSSPTATSSGVMVGVPSVWEDTGFTGAGMKIAVVDTGLDLDHPSFAEAPAEAEGSMTVGDIEKVLTDLNAYALRDGRLSAEDLYRSSKVPFAFNYVDRNLTADHSSDSQGDHGTHVSGIAAANDNVAGTDVVGMAPDAQIIVMKVFGASGGAFTDDIVAALEDAMRLDCDVVNMSLGSPAGFSSDDPEIDAIYQRVSEHDMILAVAAGNEGTSAYGNMWGTDLNATEHPENGTVGSPGTYVNSTVVASADNANVMFNYVEVAGEKFMYNDAIGINVTMAEVYGDQELEYVMVPGLGAVEDFESVDVAGKIAVISRGELNFGTKAANAEMFGAIGVIIYNNTYDSIVGFGAQLTSDDGSLPEGLDPYLPVILAPKSAADAMEAAEKKTIYVSADAASFPDQAGGQMSSFSSWGTTSDLRLLPDITGVGGNVYSCYDNGQYGLMSGTSMATPQIAGVSALVLQYIHENDDGLSDDQIHDLAEALLMSTAVPVISSDSGLPASPRQQGSGLVSAIGAVTSGAYLTVGGEKPKAELGDDESGSYRFTFEIHNTSSEAKTYTLDSSLLTEDVVDYGIGTYFMSGVETELSGSVSFSCGDEIIVSAGGTATVTATITVDENGKAWLDKYYPDGGFVEGFVYLKAQEGVDLSLPFMGFYGDWTESDLFDSAYWYDNTFWSLEPAEGYVDGDQYYNVMWTSLNGTDWVLGMNPYADQKVDEEGNLVYDPANNVISPNRDGAVDGIEEIYLSLMRNASSMTFTFTVDGQTVHTETIHNVRKTMYISGYGQIVPFLYSWYGEGLYDFTDENGDPLANGTEVILTISATVGYGDGGDHSIRIPMTVDTEAPKLTGVKQSVEDGKCYLEVTATENIALADTFVMNTSGTRVLAEQPEFTEADGIYTAVFDVTGLGTELLIALCDYACNESYYDVKYVEGGDNLPTMDTSKLYAYRISDEAISSDYMYGWMDIDKTDAMVTAHTSDYMEYYSIVAAEYAGGYIFAADAGDNLLYLVPGLWERHHICTLDVTIIDMAFDEANGVMYALTKVDGYECVLQTVDLLTGELTPVASFGYYYYAPWTLAIDGEGTFYSVIQGESSLYTLSWDEEGTGTATAVEGVILTTSSGTDVMPGYSQSMTYSKADNTLYWAYFCSSWMGSASELITIDLSNNYAATATPFHSIYNDGMQDYDLTALQEFVGLIVLEDDGYEVPAAEELSDVWMNPDRLVMQAGATETVRLNPTPWNYEMKDIQWESSDEAVATVEDGRITAVSKGNVTVTATCEGKSASCAVTVVDVEGTFYAYDYYNNSSNYGDMISVKLDSMKMTSLYAAEVDLTAGDYNGHDGHIYGYGQNGQFYRCDEATGETVALGAPVSPVPADMAYDYSTGKMYAITVDYATGECWLHQVNLNNGELHPIAVSYEPLMTLACDGEGQLFAVSAYGTLQKLLVEDGFIMGEVLVADLGYLSYGQTMCYDHRNNVLLWANTETASVYWLDVYNENPYVLSLGDPTGTGLFQFACMYTIPETIEELPYVAVESAHAKDLFMIAGTTRFPEVTTEPLNATAQSAEWISSDPAVVKINEDGSLTAVAEGVATVTGVLPDGIELNFTATVAKGTDKLYGHVLTDMATSGGQYWVRLYSQAPGQPDVLESIAYTLYSEEYYNGKLYAYAYDPNDWESNWQFMVIDPETYEIESMTDLGEGFPFVYDMTYSYDLATMFCVAGPGSEATDVYIVDMQTGKLIPYIQTSEMFMSLAAGPDGVLYAVETSTMDPDTYEYGNATLYTIDAVTKEITLVGDTGVMSNMMASMTYDYDSGYLYWATCFRMDFFSAVSGSLCLMDPETAQAHDLGMVGAAGAQVGGMYILSENLPEEKKDALHTMLIDPDRITMYLGDEPKQVSLYTLPLSLDGVNFRWSSDDETVATVDENGMVTALSEGVATITVTATYGEESFTGQCKVGVLAADAGYLTYNVTDGGWATISHKDPTVVTNLIEGEEAPRVRAISAMGSKVYGYDENNDLFELDLTTYERTIIGNAAVEVDAEDGHCFSICDMAYDSANDRLLVLGNTEQTVIYDDGYVETWEIEHGRQIYEVDLESGKLTALYDLFELGGYVHVKALAVDDQGNIYFYNTFDDNFTKLDPATGRCATLVSSQTQSIYGDGLYDFSMYYDEATGLIHALTTSNGTFYRMLTVDPTLGTLTVVGFVGDVEYDYDSWRYIADYFVGLTLVKAEKETEHVHGETELKNAKAATCTEEGYTGDLVCTDCGEVVEEGQIIPATGHAYTDVVTKPTTTEKGYTTHTCAHCGHSYVDSYTDPIGENVNTGDVFDPMLVLVLALISGAALVILTRKKRI